MPMLTIGQDSIHYQYDFKPGKPVLVLSNSLGTDLSTWEPQVAAFGEHFSLLRYDSRGHGQSSVPAGPYSIEQMGQDVLALLDGIKIEKANFCGLSMGGMVGQWLGMNAPGRLIKLVLADTAAQCGGPEFWNMNIDAAQTGGMAAAGPIITGAWYTEGFRAAQPNVVAETMAMVSKCSPEGFAASCVAIREMDFQAGVKNIPVPTLVTYGQHDMATPAVCAEFLLSQIAGAETLVTNAAHIANVEDAAGFNAGVLAFLLK